MIRRLVAGLALLTVARAAAAQETMPGRNWSVFVATGWMASEGGGSGTLMGERIPALYGLRFKIEDGGWWLGVEVDAWTARATALGRDSILARSRSTGPHTGPARYNATTLNFVARRDFWHAGRADAYLLGSIGATMGGGHIAGKCGTGLNGYPLCTESPVDNRDSGMALAGGAGAGMTVQYSHLLKPIPGWIRWVFGERGFVEGKINSQSAGEGRFTSAVGHIGIGW
jgi:hypothetical protein